jgi:anti-anti-sigma factor
MSVSLIISSTEHEMPSLTQVESRDDGIVIVTFEPSIHHLGVLHVEQLSKELQDVTRKGARRVILNVGNLQSCKSDAFGIFIDLHRRLTLVGGRLVFCGINADIMERLHIARLNEFFTITSDQDEAVRLLSGH